MKSIYEKSVAIYQRQGDCELPNLRLQPQEDIISVYGDSGIGDI